MWLTLIPCSFPGFVITPLRVHLQLQRFRGVFRPRQRRPEGRWPVDPFCLRPPYIAGILKYLLKTRPASFVWRPLIMRGDALGVRCGYDAIFEQSYDEVRRFHPAFADIFRVRADEIARISIFGDAYATPPVTAIARHSPNDGAFPHGLECSDLLQTRGVPAGRGTLSCASVDVQGCEPGSLSAPPAPGLRSPCVDAWSGRTPPSMLGASKWQRAGATSHGETRKSAAW